MKVFEGFMPQSHTDESQVLIVEKLKQNIEKFYCTKFLVKMDKSTV